MTSTSLFILIQLLWLFIAFFVFYFARTQIKSKLGSQITELQTRLEILEKEKSTLLQSKEGSTKETLALQMELTSWKTKFQDQQSLKKETETLFENIAQKILTQNTSQFEASSKKNLETLLLPLKEKLQTFEKSVSDAYHTESRERFALKGELEKIILSQQSMSEEAQKLTRALKGDNKTQGDWGEIKLEMILEKSGLFQGIEYTLQGKEMGLKGESGEHQKPDVIIHLPDEKHLIIDSKVSLTAYERYINEENKDLKEAHLKEFHRSFKKHITELNDKHYQNNIQLNCPDFVLLFCPLEAAFGLALQTQRDLFLYAWEKKIALVSPTTLHATLRTVASLWKTERQNKNALEIARVGGALYDKFVGFVEDLEKVGKSIGDTQKSYDQAFSKLKEGKGNLMSRAEKLKELGVKTTKKLTDLQLPESGESL